MGAVQGKQRRIEITKQPKETGTKSPDIEVCDACDIDGANTPADFTAAS